MNRRTARTSGLTLVAVGLWSLCGQGWAQGSKADYERAANLRQLTSGKVYRARVAPHWSSAGSHFCYRNDLKGQTREFIHVDASRGVREPAFDHETLASALSTATGKKIPASRLPMENVEYDPIGDAVAFSAEGKGWRFDRKTSRLTEGPAPNIRPPDLRPGRSRTGAAGGQDQRPPVTGAESPDKLWRAVVRENNLVLVDAQSGQETQLTKEGTPDDAHSGSLYWSPDSKKLVAMRTKKGTERRVTFVESSPGDQLQPRVHSFDYLKPGDEVPRPIPHLFDTASRKEIPVTPGLTPNPYQITEVRWAPDSSRFTFLYNPRGHQALQLIAVDAASGQARVLVDEQSKTFVDYAHKYYNHPVAASGEILWMSERSGWNHLYLLDDKTGAIRNAITKGDWVVRGVDRVDDEKRQVWFRAGGIIPGQDPYYIHFARVNYDGTGLTLLTEGDGTHSIEYSPDRRFIIDTWSRVDLPPVTELRRAEDGKRLCELERGDWADLLGTGWRAPERFVAKARDGKTDIYGIICRPTNFDASKRYPVVEAIYAGPQGSFVPKAFSSLHSAQSMAELGFIVVQIDGMGTSNRSKAFHDVCWKNLGDAGFPDRILWMRAAAAKYPEMDLSRVGLYGGSAGGQNAMRGLLAHPEFYKVGVAACGCHDNRMDKIWWNELWMGWPVGPHYDEQSNTTQAHRLQGQLMLIVGEMDRNVDPASTMQVVNALIKANKDFDLVVVPGAGHGVGGAYGARRQQDFLVRHLLGVEPRWDKSAPGGR